MLAYLLLELWVVLYHETESRISLSLFTALSSGFGYKIQKKVITSAMLTRMAEVFQNVCKKNKSLMMQLDGESDHVHLLLDLHPDNNISQLVSSLKAASSRVIRKDFKAEVDRVYFKPAFWSGSYYIATCGGVTIERLRKYIEQQDSPN